MLNSVRFDWFSFTIKGKTVKEVMLDLGLKTEDFELCEFSRYGYQRMITHSVFDISILYDGTADMGVHVAVSGSAIRYFMECYVSEAGVMTPFGDYAIMDRCYFTSFARYVLANGRFARVDVNIDTKMEFFNPYNIRNLAKDEKLISYFRHWKMFENSDGSGTFYLGKRSSSSFVRIYDKAKEQGDFKNTLYRFEVQFNKMADDFMRNFVEHGLSSAFYSYLDKQMRFVDSSGDYTSISVLEWLQFLKLVHDGKIEEFTCYDSKRKNNSIDSVLHMFRQYNSIIGDFLEKYGTIDDFIEFMFNVARFKDSEMDLLDYMDSKGWT